MAKYAGLKRRKRRSAEFEAEETPLARTGNRYLRSYFWEAANRVRMCDSEYAAYYKRKFNQARKHQPKTFGELSRAAGRWAHRPQAGTAGGSAADDQPAVSAHEDVAEPSIPPLGGEPPGHSLLPPLLL